MGSPVCLKRVEMITTENRLPHVLTVREAARLLGMTAGGVRGAILRGKLPASTDTEGRLVLRSHNLAAYHLYGDARRFPEDRMRAATRAALHDYLETVTSE